MKCAVTNPLVYLTEIVNEIQSDLPDGVAINGDDIEFILKGERESVLYFMSATWRKEGDMLDLLLSFDDVCACGCIVRKLSDITLAEGFLCKMNNPNSSLWVPGPGFLKRNQRRRALELLHRQFLCSTLGPKGLRELLESMVARADSQLTSIHMFLHGN